MSASNFNQNRLMDMNKKEIWVDNTMNSIDKIERVPVSNNLNIRLTRISKSVKIQVFRIHTPTRWAIAAAITALFLINVYTLSKTSKKGNSEGSVFAREYFSYMNSI